MDKPVILVVDDSPSDVMLMRVAFANVGWALPLQCATDGDDAIAYLQGIGRYRDRALFPVPAIVLLDLNMPWKNGFEVLAWIRRQPAFQQLCVYILSASGRQEDIKSAYELGANFYLVKPRNLDGLILMAQSLVAWLETGHFAPAAVAAASQEPATSGGGGARGDHAGRHPITQAQGTAG